MSSLNAILLLLFATVILGIMLHASRQRIGMVQYPFLASAVMAGWVFPQLVGLSVLPIAPAEAVAKTIFFSMLCLIAGWVGYATNNRAATWLQWPFSKRRLLIASAVLSLVGYFFWMRVAALAEEANELYGGQWSGVITIYVFLGSMLTIGLAMAVVVHLHRPSKISLAIIIFDMALILEQVLLKARREVMMELFVFSMLYLWWRYRWLPPRMFIIGAVVFGALVVNSAGDVRGSLSSASDAGSFDRVVSVFTKTDLFIANLKATLEDPMRSAELLNAALTIEAAERRLSFDGGAILWNRFVFSYIPGQIIGNDVKQGLMIPTEDVALLEFGHVANVGATHTGMADAFRSYWYFGAGVFFLIGLIMSRWFRAANAGHPAAQMVILLITAKSLLAITHTTPHFFLQFVSLAAFLLPALLFARARLVVHRAHAV